MSHEDLELLITLGDPEGAPEEDKFNHPAENTIDQRAEAVVKATVKNEVSR